MRVVGLSILMAVTGGGALGLPLPGVDAGGDFDAFDAGPRVGAGDAGGVTPVDSGTPFDSGVADSGAVDSGAPPDSGASMVNDSGTPTGPFQSATLSLVTARGNVVQGVSGAGSEVYLVTDFELFRSSGGAFEAVPLDSKAGPGIYPSMRGLYVAPNGAVFAVAQGEIFVCSGNCADGGVAFTTTTPLATTKQGRAMCGDSATRVFAVFVPCIWAL